MKQKPLTIGRVIWYDLQKGYGFIDNRNGDVFVHYSAISPGNRNLKPGQAVKYRLEQSNKGLYATACSPLHIQHRKR